MKLRPDTAFLLLLLSSVALAQGDRPITELVGRHIRVEVSLSGAFLGLGGSMAPLGGPAASRVDAGCVGWNPAGLAALHRRSVVLDWVPGLAQNAQSLADLSGTLNEQLDAIIDDYGAPSAAVHYPELVANVGFHPLVSGFALGVPFRVRGRKVGIGLGYRQP
ncbi:MAG: hypothetical protein H5U38_07710, partial [Calditrichaeota bacterium]|nr:hypothetical protein [Calditrichota bacterium]